MDLLSPHIQKGEKGSEAELSPSVELWDSQRLSAKSLHLAVIDAAIAEDSKHSQICNMKGGGWVFQDPWFELPCHPMWKDWPHLCLMEHLWGFGFPLSGSPLRPLFA